MNFDVWIPILDAVSKALEAVPTPAMAVAGAVLAGVVLVLRRWSQTKAKVAATVAEVVPFPAKQASDTPADSKVAAEVTKIVDSTIK